MCLYAETLEENAISIGTHLINDFYAKSSNQFDKTILDDKKKGQQVTTEMLALNFEMRSKKFIEEVNL